MAKTGDGPCGVAGKSSGAKLLCGAVMASTPDMTMTTADTRSDGPKSDLPKGREGILYPKTLGLRVGVGLAQAGEFRLCRCAWRGVDLAHPKCGDQHKHGTADRDPKLKHPAKDLRIPNGTQLETARQARPRGENRPGRAKKRSRRSPIKTTALRVLKNAVQSWATLTMICSAQTLEEPWHSTVAGVPEPPIRLFGANSRELDAAAQSGSSVGTETEPPKLLLAMGGRCCMKGEMTPAPAKAQPEPMKREQARKVKMGRKKSTSDDRG